MLRRTAIASTAFALIAGSTRAAEVYTIDKVHSEAAFAVRHLVTKVRGRFTDFAGTVRIDRETPEASSVELTIEASSIDTANADRDKHLRSEDFFHVEKFPQITFRSTRIEPKGDDLYRVTGTFTMRGVSKEITLPVKLLGFVKDPWGNEKAGFGTEHTLNRKDYGIVWNKALDAGGFILGDEVEVEISLQIQKQKPEAAE